MRGAVLLCAFVGFFVKNLSFGNVSGKNSKLKVDAKSLSEYERVRRDFVRLEFPDCVLKGRFGLSSRLSDFAREYALSGNANAAALYAGFSRSTAKNCSKRIVKKCSSAVEVIRAALLETGDSYKVALKEHLTAAMLDIVDDRKEAPGPAVMACKVLFELYRLDVPVSLNKENEKAGVPDEEIKKSLIRCGVLPPEN